MTTFNLGQAIMEVRAIEQKLEAMEDAFKEKIKPLKDYAQQKRDEILTHLLTTGQKSANTPYGGAYWKEQIRYSVADKDEFRRHVIGTESWQLLTWAAASVAAEEFTKEHGEPPPGTKRSAVVLPYVTAPVKPRTGKVVNDNEPEQAAAE